MTGRLIFLLIVAAAAFTLGVLAVHRPRRQPRRPRPDERAAAYREGVRAEAARWEAVTGVPFERLQAWRTGRGPDPFANLAAETEVLPSAEVLLAEADAALGKPQGLRVPSVTEVDEMAAQWHAAHGHGEFTRELADDFRSWQHRQGMPPERLGDEWDRIHPGWRRHTGREPVVADITDAARWRPWEDDTPTITGTVVEPSRHHDPGADWDMLAGSALPDYAAAALGGHRTVDELVDSIVMRAMKP